MEKFIYILVEQLENMNFKQEFLNEFLFDMNEDFQFAHSRDYYENRFYDFSNDFGLVNPEASEICLQISMLLG